MMCVFLGGERKQNHRKPTTSPPKKKPRQVTGMNYRYKSTKALVWGRFSGGSEKKNPGIGSRFFWGEVVSLENNTCLKKGAWKFRLKQNSTGSGKILKHSHINPVYEL